MRARHGVKPVVTSKAPSPNVLPAVQVMSQVLVSVGLMVLGPVLLAAATKEKDRAMAYTLVLAGAVGLVYSAVRYFIGRQNPVRA